MAALAQQLPFFAGGQVVAGVGFKIGIGQGKIPSSGRQLQDTVGGRGGQMLRGEGREQILKFSDIVAGEELLGEMSGPVVRGEVLLKAELQVPLLLVVAIDWMFRQ